MNAEMPFAADNQNHFDHIKLPLRVIGIGSSGHEANSSWYFVNSDAESLGKTGSDGADCILIDAGNSGAISLAAIGRAALPLVVAMPADDSSTGRMDDGLAALIDAADGYVLPSDPGAVVAAVLATAVAGDNIGWRAADLSDGAARTMQALSVEASRIAEQLSALAAQEAASAAPVRAIDAALVRRLIKLRRDRERFFPADIFADPAWDMLLDLTAARLEHKPVPVSSLCIAAAVPTTTALRWIRSLTEAGLLTRRVDSQDGRRSHVELSETAAAAMLGYLRLFCDQFAAR
jgi:DNA-binding transcriptional ArsR family regulator